MVNELVPLLPPDTEVEVFEISLHTHPLALRRRLQQAIDASDGRYDPIYLGYGLCAQAVVSLTAKLSRLIIPKSEDCIELFLGSRATYDAYFGENPGTFYKTSGWIERDHDNLEDVAAQAGVQSPFGALRTFEAYCEKYGEDNARYLMETLGGLHNYSRMTFIEMPGLAPLPYDEDTRGEAERTGLTFDHKAGDLGWIRRLAHGPWRPEEFLVVPPGERIAPSYDELVIRATAE